MKSYVIMQRDKEYDVYTFKGSDDWRFYPILKILNDDFRPGWLIKWLYDDTKISTGSEWISIDKEDGVIALYDVSDSMDETYTGAYRVPEKRFDISVQNFAEIVLQWEELRVSRPDIILVIIHEDNYISLETDPVIIKKYQDVGYVFDVNKHN